MALFRIYKGQNANLPSAIKEGYCYLTTDEHKFYVDISETERIELNARIADTAKKVEKSLTVNGQTFDGSSEIKIPYINVAYGGTGATTAVLAMDNLANATISDTSSSLYTDFTNGTQGTKVMTITNSDGSINAQKISFGSSTTKHYLILNWNYGTNYPGLEYEIRNGSTNLFGSNRILLDSVNFTNYAATANHTHGISVLRGTTTAASATSSITIPFSGTTINDDTPLMIYQNGLLLIPTTHYTLGSSAITLTYTANAGDIFEFVLLQELNSMITDLTEGEY